MMSHIDKDAANKVIGYENSYVEAMAKPDHYYGNKRQSKETKMIEARGRIQRD